MRFSPLVENLPASVPFIGPDRLERERGAAFTARLGANENGFGPSPLAVNAMQRALQDVWKYGNPESHNLRDALAVHHAVSPDQIVVGEGIDALLGLLVRLVVGPGDSVVTSAGAYPTFNYHAAGFGAKLHMVPYRDDHEDLAALIARARQTGARLIYLANPDNPMGSWLPAQQIEAALDDLPANCLLILDEAYAEFAPDEAIPAIDPANPRVIRFRTFSKAYALAGARIGYAIGAQDLIAGFERIRNHFGVNAIAQAGALAALADRDWLRKTTRAVADARAQLTGIATRNGLSTLPSATNFVAIDCGRDGALARAVLDGLAREGVFVRMPNAVGLDRCIRVSCAPPPELEIFDAALARVLSGL